MPKRGGSGNVYICVPRQEAVRILGTLWVCVRNLPTNDPVATRFIMEDMIDIADAVDYFDKRHEVKPDTIGNLVAEGLSWFDKDTLETCKD